MAKKSKKIIIEEENSNVSIKDKAGKGAKNQKTELETNQKQKTKNGRAIVAQTTSWTGKLPGSLLHEHCQKQKWNKVEYDMKKLSNGFIAIPQLSWENPKTKELIQIKFYPPKEIVNPQETPIEARHYAATYALHRIAFNKNLHMVLPTNHKNLWSDLEIERKKIMKNDLSRSKLEYANDPFIALLEKRKEDAIKKKELEVKQASLEKVKKQTIVIGTTKPIKSSPKYTENENKNVIKKIIRNDKTTTESYKPQKTTTNSNNVSFPKKVWDNSILFDLDSELRISIEDAIRNHIEWSETELSTHENVKHDSPYSELLVKLGFRQIHVEESLKYTYTFNDSLEWLLFHLPEDDLPSCFTKSDTDSNIKLQISKDIKQDRAIMKLMEGGYSKNDAISSLEHNNYDLIKSAVYLTDNLLKTDLSFDKPNELNSFEEWMEEKNSLKIIFESKIKEDDPPKDDVFEIILNVEGIEDGLLALKVYRSEYYPYDICGLFILVRNPSYSLPNYIKKSIIINLLKYLIEIGACGIPYIYSSVDWLEQNILKIIQNPGPLYSPPDELQKFLKKGIEKYQLKETLSNKKISNKKQINIEKIGRHYQERVQSSNFHQSLENRAKLPAWKKKDDIVKVINENNVCLITGETGSGKSTQIVQFILDNLNGKNDYKTTIICTQPRRISTIGLADRISEERIDKCGLETGYIIRGEKKTTDETRIVFATTGVMLRMIQSVFGKTDGSKDAFFDKLGYIFIDEVHERSIDSDFLLIILKKMMKDFPNLKIVLMSATIDKNIFKGFFDENKQNSIAHVHIEGRTFPIVDYYLDDILKLTDFKISNYRNNSNWDDNENYDDMIKPSADSKFFQSGNINYDLISSLVCKIDDDLNAKNDNGSILIFLPGEMEIRKCLNTIDDDRFWKLPLHSALSSNEQKRIFQNPPSCKRKIIASTNIAETSITIPDAVAVIDTGRVKCVQYDSKSNNTKLTEMWASYAETRQRRGRAGRIRNGLCYKLFTRDTEHKMISQPIPEIKRTRLESIYLTVRSMGVRDVYQFLQNGLDPPHKNNVDNAQRVLKDIGALQHNDDELTALGKYLSMLPADLKAGKTMIFGCIFGCLESCITLASIGVTGSPFSCKQEDRDEMKKIQQGFGKDNGDMIAILNAYNQFKSLKTMKERRKYCTENFISLLRINDIDSTRIQYLNNLKEIGFIPFSYDPNKISDSNFVKFNRNNGNINMIKTILTASLYPQIARVELPDTKYAQISSGAIALDPEFKKIKYWTRNEKYRTLLETGGEGINDRGEIYPSTRIFMHPSSSLFINDEKSKTNPPFIVFNNAQETSKLYVHGITPTSTLAILLFGGNITYDLSSTTNSSRSRGIVMDNWLPIRTWCKNAVLIGKLRLLLDKTIQEKLENPKSNDGDDVLCIIEKLVKINT
jgi:HrpA-like RNA helicase